MEREQRGSPIGHLPEDGLVALSKLSDKLEARDVLRVAAPLVKLMETEENSNSLSQLVEALAGLTTILEGNVVQPAAAAVLKRMGRRKMTLSFGNWAAHWPH